ncbi:MAG: FG-GAP-like repeat-containing protein [Chlorobi bacterium]|nr:FG-GAP-like repeat-containing protein [Chlorobiota bacterium]MCI0715800.1 FG-GAP-like repeat-containing protein [Chlorobiota bacterium]
MRKFYGIILISVVFISHNIIGQTFTNVGPQMGLSHMYLSGFNGGGLSFVDYNSDGYDDLFLSSSFGRSIVVEKNNVTGFINVTQSFNFTEVFESKTTLCSDYDNDGDQDILIVHFLGFLKLYRNNGGTYHDVTASSGLSTDSLNATAAMWFDYNRDGWLDLYVGVYTGFGNNLPKPNKLYKNLGNGNFQDVSVSSNTQNSGNKVLALAVIDYNNDFWPDIYVASDRRYGNSLLKNNANGTFSDVSQQSGAYLEMDAMGLAVGDYDNNGYFDIYISNGEEGNAFLKNNGNGTFSDVAGQLNMSVNRICWGNNFFDYDNDGDIDLYIAVSGGPSDRNNVLFRNNNNGTFTKMTGIGLENDNFQSYGCAIGDVDNNGYIDIACMNTGDPVSLFRSSGGSNKWLKIKLQGTYSNRDGVGSVIEVWRNGTNFKRPVLCGQSYCSQNSLIQTIGVGSVSVIDSVVVYWPSGIRQGVTGINTNQTITIVEAGVIGINNNNSQIPDKFKLAQNYPNPFNPSTVIEYSVPKSTYITIKLYDILGNEISVLESSYKNPGNYFVSLSSNITSRLASGVYYYKLTSADFTDTKKMILIK